MTPDPPWTERGALSTVEPVLVFDGDCGFCTTTAGLARRWVARSGQYAVAPWQELDLRGYGLTAAACVAAAQFVDGGGRVHSGHLAIAAALRHGSFPWQAVGAVVGAPGVQRVAAAVYGWVAEHRYALPGGTPTCERR